MRTLVLTVIGDDRPGLVDALASVIVKSGGNWDESNLSNLAGKFAGIVVVTVPDEQVTELREGLHGLSTKRVLDISVEVAEDHAAVSPERLVSLDLVGADRPGIVQQIAHALASHGVSFEELQTATTSAPMAGEPLFEASALLHVPTDVELDALRATLEELANELMVDLDVDVTG